MVLLRAITLKRVVQIKCRSGIGFNIMHKLYASQSSCKLPQIDICIEVLKRFNRLRESWKRMI